jgi:hypothetical protein
MVTTAIHTANMRTIHKHLLGTGFGPTTLSLHGTNVKLLSIGTQSNAYSKFADVFVWYELDTRVPTYTEIELYVAGTGWELPEVPLKFIGTTQSGDFVYHVFQVLEEVLGDT